MLTTILTLSASRCRVRDTQGYYKIICFERATIERFDVMPAFSDILVLFYLLTLVVHVV